MVICYCSKKNRIAGVVRNLGHWRPISRKWRGGTKGATDKVLNKGESLGESGSREWPVSERKAEQKF